MDLTEGVGESSSPPRSFGNFNSYDIRNDVFNRLVEIGCEEAIWNSDFRDNLDAHFNRLLLVMHLMLMWREWRMSCYIRSYLKLRKIRRSDRFIISASLASAYGLRRTQPGLVPFCYIHGMAIKTGQNGNIIFYFNYWFICTAVEIWTIGLSVLIQAKR
ncbi:uncharacterized protein [Gossypium hirsutum]|uniref:Uncharacterized protein n=1 Tax=Gossypium hirsutum TaxID=3635 RepID=A0ABM3BSM5_GOSHI|nr:uncharacterized protein LOC121229526 [Gossypium hirsutum]